MNAKLDRISPNELKANPRATLAAWAKYEVLVKAAYAQHPKTYVYAPQNLSPATVASRLRDAIRGAIAFEYPSEITPSDLQRWYSEVIIKHDKTHVYIGPEISVTESLQGHSVTPEQTYSYPSLSLEEVIAFTILLSHGRILGPVTIQQPPDIAMLPERENVEILPRPDGSIVLL